MEIVKTIAEVRRLVHQARQDGKTIGFVPTMGALHAGHGSLIERSVRECGFTVVSIFVNPTQFGPREDLDKYPRTLEADAALCGQLGADLIFAPSAAEMYPQKQFSWVVVEEMTAGLCGACRPGHFRGVTTVCAKLFNIVGPDKAYFGQKDAQQAAVIKRMAQDLNMPLEICVCPTVRETDGLAMSSRNRYLAPDERQRALVLSQSLEQCRRMLLQGERNPEVLRNAMESLFCEANVEVEYIEFTDPETMEKVQTVGDRVLVAIAAKVGSTRLIDNEIIDLQGRKSGV